MAKEYKIINVYKNFREDTKVEDIYSTFLDLKNKMAGNYKSIEWVWDVLFLTNLQADVDKDYAKIVSTCKRIARKLDDKDKIRVMGFMRNMFSIVNNVILADHEENQEEGQEGKQEKLEITEVATESTDLDYEDCFIVKKFLGILAIILLDKSYKNKFGQKISSLSDICKNLGEYRKRYFNNYKDNISMAFEKYRASWKFNSGDIQYEGKVVSAEATGGMTVEKILEGTSTLEVAPSELDCVRELFAKTLSKDIKEDLLYIYVDLTVQFKNKVAVHELITYVSSASVIVNKLIEYGMENITEEDKTLIKNAKILLSTLLMTSLSNFNKYTNDYLKEVKNKKERTLMYNTIAMGQKAIKKCPGVTSKHGEVTDFELAKGFEECERNSKLPVSRKQLQKFLREIEDLVITYHDFLIRRIGSMYDEEECFGSSMCGQLVEGYFEEDCGVAKGASLCKDLFNVLRTREYILPKNGVVLDVMHSKVFNKSANVQIYVNNYLNEDDSFIIEIGCMGNTWILNVTEGYGTSIGNIEPEILRIVLRFFKCDLTDIESLRLGGVIEEDTDIDMLCDWVVYLDVKDLTDIEYEVCDPVYWKYRGLTKLSTMHKELPNGVKVTKRIKIEAFTRNLPAGQKPSKEARDREKLYCLKLKPGKTIVSSFERDCKVLAK